MSVKRLTSFILIAAMLFSLCAGVSVSALDVTPTAGGPAEQNDESTPQPADVYFITQEEFEKYRDDYFAEKPVALSNNLKESFLLFPAGLLTPFLLPILIFIPLGGYVAGTALAAPYIVTTNLIESIREIIDFNMNKDELYNSFSTDNLYASPEYIYEENGYEIIGVNYSIIFKETNEEIPVNALPVAIKNS